MPVVVALGIFSLLRTLFHCLFSPSVLVLIVVGWLLCLLPDESGRRGPNRHLPLLYWEIPNITCDLYLVAYFENSTIMGNLTAWISCPLTRLHFSWEIWKLWWHRLAPPRFHFSASHKTIFRCAVDVIPNLICPVRLSKRLEIGIRCDYAVNRAINFEELTMFTVRLCFHVREGQ